MEKLDKCRVELSQESHRQQCCAMLCCACLRRPIALAAEAFVQDA